MKIVLAQVNPIVGDISGNLSRLLSIVAEWKDQADLVIFPELFLVGYPPRDLLGEPWFIEKIRDGVHELIRKSAEFQSTGILFGAPTPNGEKTGVGLRNSAILIENGKLLFVQHKSLLPTYDVFDESRYFDPESAVDIFTYKGVRLGISICEDAWNDPDLWPDRIYSWDPVASLAAQGADLLINISASPFYLEKESIRYRLLSNHARKHGRTFLFVNQVGGNDELVFDGSSLCFDKQGNPTAVFPSFREHVELVDTSAIGSPNLFSEPERIQSLRDALVLGIHDYVHKCGFTSVVIGLSGGIDSAVVASLAVDALGAENVLGIAMPSKYSAQESVQLAHQLAENLKLRFKIVPIGAAYDAYVESLSPEIQPAPGQVGVTFENLQARIRGNILMAFSNQLGSLVLSTGNKSEVATGYCTLYGDMAGGLAAISDVPKTMVYELANHINCNGENIPKRIITRPPTAELKPNQTDQDTLPPYEILDGILNCYIEERLSRDQIVARGYDCATVDGVIRTVNRNEYKRRQAAPGLKVTSKAFGSGRRMPIAARLDP
jgi:NAD+ synthase (glutamine-hydrolysing)